LFLFSVFLQHFKDALKGPLEFASNQPSPFKAPLTLDSATQQLATESARASFAKRNVKAAITIHKTPPATPTSALSASPSVSASPATSTPKSSVSSPSSSPSSPSSIELWQQLQSVQEELKNQQNRITVLEECLSLVVNHSSGLPAHIGDQIANELASSTPMHVTYRNQKKKKQLAGKTVEKEEAVANGVKTEKTAEDSNEKTVEKEEMVETVEPAVEEVEEEVKEAETVAAAGTVGGEEPADGEDEEMVSKGDGEEEEEEDDAEESGQTLTEEEIMKMTVTVLKEHLKKWGVPAAGRKAELQQKLKDTVGL
jgi:hypothetical protein